MFVQLRVWRMYKTDEFGSVNILEMGPVDTVFEFVFPFLSTGWSIVMTLLSEYSVNVTML
ncbi:hypothetical protein Taro_021561 [Colocasia esculenta]|uniref:Uncharacterized protein n=1 Tax=Colocasia esculenta TaxID=4460 RepID=A0A843UZE7_COLES|nr:hypothetical protein [Colocasia esculenta]